MLMHSLVWGDGYRWQPPAGARPGQVHTVPRPAYMVVVLDVDESEKEDARKDRLSAEDLIPLRLEHAEDVVQNVKLAFKQFPLDLGFATTFHKVQGQTLERVIMFLHERKTRQLAKLQWESLYVAMTRVKSGDNMRVCYRGSEDTTRKNTNGLHTTSQKVVATGVIRRMASCVRQRWLLGPHQFGEGGFESSMLSTT